MSLPILVIFIFIIIIVIIIIIIIVIIIVITSHHDDNPTIKVSKSERVAEVGVILALWSLFG